MAQAKTISCLLCPEKVYFTLIKIKTYLNHLKSEHLIESHHHLILIINLMDKNYVDYFLNMTPVSKPKTLICLLCQKETNFSDEKGDQYSSHLKNEHKIIFNLQLIRSISLMDNSVRREIVKKFEDTYDIDDEVSNEEKMLIEDESTLNDSMTIAQREREEKFGEELINGPEEINYYKFKSEDAETVDHSNLKFDSVIKSEASNRLSYGTSGATLNRKPFTSTKGVKSEKSDFSNEVKREIERGNLSTTMDISYEKTRKKMKEISAMFMKGTSCTICGKMSDSKSHLHEHIESLHNPLPVYFCHLCQLPLTSTAGYRSHKRNH